MGESRGVVENIIVEGEYDRCASPREVASSVSHSWVKEMLILECCPCFQEVEEKKLQ